MRAVVARSRAVERDRLAERHHHGGEPRQRRRQPGLQVAAQQEVVDASVTIGQLAVAARADEGEPRGRRVLVAQLRHQACDAGRRCRPGGIAAVGTGRHALPDLAQEVAVEVPGDHDAVAVAQLLVGPPFQRRHLLPKHRAGFAAAERPLRRPAGHLVEPALAAAGLQMQVEDREPAAAAQLQDQGQPGTRAPSVRPGLRDRLHELQPCAERIRSARSGPGDHCGGDTDVGAPADREVLPDFVPVPQLGSARHAVAGTEQDARRFGVGDLLKQHDVGVG